jgi:homogentisate 1,2-dioxygenase
VPYYHRCGDIPPKRHTQHRRPDGRLYAEELMGEEGFFSDSSLLYHQGLPSAVVDATPWELPDQVTAENRPLLPRHLKLHELFPDEDWKALDAVTGRRLVLGNGDVRVSYVVAGEASPLYRNAIGDECVYVESGTATVETVFGALSARQGDYVLLPRATAHRWVPQGEDPLRLYVIEANSHIAPPKRYLSRFGQFLEHSPYCETCTARRSRCSPRVRTWSCWSNTAVPGASPAPATCSRPTPSTSSAGTAASTRTRSTSPTSSRSPAGCTSPRRCTRCSRATTS